MDSIQNRYLSHHLTLPFQELTDFDIGMYFQSTRERIIELMVQHDLVVFLKCIWQRYVIIKIVYYVLIKMKVNV